jgi:hypothetical protein
MTLLVSKLRLNDGYGVEKMLIRVYVKKLLAQNSADRSLCGGTLKMIKNYL